MVVADGDAETGIRVPVQAQVPRDDDPDECRSSGREFRQTDALPAGHDMIAAEGAGLAIDARLGGGEIEDGIGHHQNRLHGRMKMEKVAFVRAPPK